MHSFEVSCRIDEIDFADGGHELALMCYAVPRLRVHKCFRLLDRRVEQVTDSGE
jgi:hypothetical protein